MHNVKGPYGQFAIERTEENKIFRYAAETLAKDTSGCYLDLSVNQIGNTFELSYDHSGLVSLREYESLTPDKTNLFLSLKKDDRSRRQSAGTFFLSILDNLNNLLSPSLIVLDPNYIYTDEDGTQIKVIFKPYKEQPDDLTLSQINAQEIENLFRTKFFDEILTQDEKQMLIHAVESGNEDLFRKTAEQIKNTEEEQQTEKKQNQDLTRLIPPLSAALFSVWCLINVGRKAACVFVLAGAALLTNILIKEKNKKDTTKKSTNSEMRKEILFAQETENTNSGLPYAEIRQTNQEENQLQFAIYTDKTTIGSDRFLSDIILNDDTVDPVHAKIERAGTGYILTDLSQKRTTYIDDKALPEGRACEIKNGQKLTFGELEFRFKTNQMSSTIESRY